MKIPSGDHSYRFQSIDICLLLKVLDSSVKNYKTCLLLPSLLLKEKNVWKLMNSVNIKKQINPHQGAYLEIEANLIRGIISSNRTKVNSHFLKEPN
jgi:hypothetical protein